MRLPARQVQRRAASCPRTEHTERPNPRRFGFGSSSGGAMSPLQMSAQFAAFLWFVKQDANKGKPREEAHRFARLNWEKFLPAADEGFGRLLNAIAQPAEEPRRAKRASLARE